MKHLSRVEFAVLADELQGFYGIENFKEEGISWYEMWLNRTGDCSEISYPELLLQAKTFFPAVANAIEVALALPVTTCTVERSFSTLRRVKTWLRSTMRNDRLDGLSTRQKRYREHLGSLEKRAEEDRRIKKLEIALEKRRLAMEERQIERRLATEERQHVAMINIGGI
ncbi:hypothetical protein HPB47_009175 [Ixodes persulcatus]|uniref:Uncharacterized protein n=1 Tax=Ixodes persulcatus TaxID=34615 RepID=A0AC60P2R0_IXOPE|nr:hypothetical protein HPB47_009175 [Ixodes persulcatus]